MQRIMRRYLFALLAVAFVGGACGRKTMQTPPTLVPLSPTPAPQPPGLTPSLPPRTPPASESTLVLRDAFFDFDSASLRDDARAALTEDARLLLQNASTVITIEGHCDERGSVDYNLALGERRATAAMDFLVNYGAPSARIETVSYGKLRPFAMGHNTAAWAQNRRAHLVVQNP